MCSRGSSLRGLLLFVAAISIAGCEEEAPEMSARVEAGSKVFADYCAVCHQIQSSTHSQTAPSLKNIIGRKAGSGSFNYSNAFSDVDFVWTAENMLVFLEKPREFLPGNSMAFYGLEQVEDRETLVEFLMFHSN